MDEEKNETIAEEVTESAEVTETVTTKKKNPIILVVILLVLVILGLTGYILVDKGIIFGKDSKESSSKKDNKDEKPADKDPEKEPEKEPDKETDNEKLTEYSSCKEINRDTNYDHTELKCTIGTYTYTVITDYSEDEDSVGYDGTIKNKDGKVIAKFSEGPDDIENNYAFNSDGSVTILGSYSKDGYDYTRYSYEGKKLNQVDNYKKVENIFDNYLLVVVNDHVKLQDYKGNYIKGFDFDLSKGNYELHSALSGWYTDKGKNGIFVVIGNNDIEDEEVEGAGIEYYYEPSTGKVGTILTEGVGGYAKPVLYLYPEKDTKVSVSFEKPELLTTTYPKFRNSWNVIAKPNGDLYDESNKYYYGLYWEENGSTKVDFTEGFYVTKESAIKFLEEKLSNIGLTDRERNEFIMYWLPILEKNNKSVVYFELTEEREAYNKLNISPAPDSLLRVAIHVKKVDEKPSNLKEEKLTKFERKGFTAVEWGGVIHN